MNRLIAIVIVSGFLLSCSKASDAVGEFTPTAENPAAIKEEVNPIIGKWTYTTQKNLVHSNNSYYIWIDYYLEFKSDNTVTIKLLENKQVMGHSTIYRKISSYSTTYETSSGILIFPEFTSENSCMVSKGKIDYTIGSYNQMLYLKVTSQNWTFNLGRVQKIPSIFTDTSAQFSACAF